MPDPAIGEALRAAVEAADHVISLAISGADFCAGQGDREAAVTLRELADRVDAAARGTFNLAVARRAGRSAGGAS